MKTEKHEAKKKDILESAFRIWGGCRYKETSLSQLASELNITKQALYRYFASKEKLESAMEDIALDNYDQSARHLQDELSEMTDDKWTEAYVEGTVSFFQNHGRYMGFLTYRYRTKQSWVRKSRGNTTNDSVRWRRIGRESPKSVFAISTH
jgi:AcrR family transcriptional regulator